MDGSPDIEIKSPINGTLLTDSSPVLDIQVTDVGEIMKVELFLDDQLISTKLEAPFGWSELDKITALESLTAGNFILRVKATDIDLNITEEEIMFTIQIILGTPEYLNNVSVYPNPFADDIFIDNTAGQWKAVRLTDYTGKDLMNAQLTTGISHLVVGEITKVRGVYRLWLSNHYSEKVIVLLNIQ